MWHRYRPRFVTNCLAFCISLPLAFYVAICFIGIADHLKWQSLASVLAIVGGTVLFGPDIFAIFLVALFRNRLKNAPVALIEFFFVDKYEEIDRESLKHHKRTENNPTIR